MTGKKGVPNLGTFVSKHPFLFAVFASCVIAGVVGGVWFLPGDWSLARRLAGGAVAEVTVFDPAAVGTRPLERRSDFPTGADRLVGMFINTIPSRVVVDSDATVADWLRGIQAAEVHLSTGVVDRVRGWFGRSR